MGLHSEVPGVEMRDGLRGDHPAEPMDVTENHGRAHSRRFQRAAALGKDEIVILQNAFGRRDLAARGPTHAVYGNASSGASFRSRLPVRAVAGVVAENQRAPRNDRQRGPGQKSRLIYSVADHFNAAPRS